MTRAVWRGLVLQSAEVRRSPLTLITAVVQPLAFVTLLLHARADAAPEYVGRVVAGTTMMSVWSVTLWTAGSALLRDRLGGTLATMLVRPAPVAAVLFGRSLCVAVVGLTASTVVVGAVVAVRGTPAAMPGPAVLAVLAVLSALSGACLGMLLGAVNLVARGAPRMIEALLYLVFALGGLLVPTELVPVPLRAVAELVSLRHVVEMVGARRLVPAELLAAAGLSGVYCGLGLLLMKTALRRARRRGTLELA